MLSRRKVDDDGGRGGGGEFWVGLGTDDGDKYFCSLKVHRLVTQIPSRIGLLFDIARLPLTAK